MTQIGGSLKSCLERLERMRLDPERGQRQIELAEELDNQWQYYKAEYLKNLFDIGYTDDHKPELVPCPELINQCIQTLYQEGIGALFIGNPGIGKSHILLEMASLILEMTYQHKKENGFMLSDINPLLTKTVQYYYLQDICTLFFNREKVNYAKFNFIDDFGVELVTVNSISFLNTYFEEIARRKLAIVVTSNGTAETLSKRVGFGRIISRLAKHCKVYTLPGEDQRKNQESLGIRGWSVD